MRDWGVAGFGIRRSCPGRGLCLSISRMSCSTLTTRSSWVITRPSTSNTVSPGGLDRDQRRSCRAEAYRLRPARRRSVRIFRTDSLFTVWAGVLVVPLFVPWSSLLTRRALAILVGPMVASLGFLCWYNELRVSQHRPDCLPTTSWIRYSTFARLEGISYQPGKRPFRLRSADGRGRGETGAAFCRIKSCARPFPGGALPHSSRAASYLLRKVQQLVWWQCVGTPLSPAYSRAGVLVDSPSAARGQSAPGCRRAGVDGGDRAGRTRWFDQLLVGQAAARPIAGSVELTFLA